MVNAGSGELPCGGADSTYESTVLVSAAGEEIAVSKSEMEVHAVRAVKQEENPCELDFPQSLNHTIERQYHDPTTIELPLAKFQRALNPHVEQLSAALQTTPNVEADNVHHTNDLERLTVVASDTISASELDEPRNARATDKAQVVAEMVEYAFATCEGSNYNPGTRMVVSSLLQFLSKQYEEDKALAVVEIERLKEEKMKLEEQHNLAMENFLNSASELEELKKKGVKSPHDLEHENEELRTVIAAMGADMDVVKEKYNTIQSEFLSTSTWMKKEKLEQKQKYDDMKRSSLQQVSLMKATIRDRDMKIALQNEEMMILMERVGKETYHIPQTTPNPPMVSSKLKQVPPELVPCDPVTQEMEGPKRKKPRCKKGLDCASVSISGSMDATAPQKFRVELSCLLTSIMTLGKTLDCKMKEFNPVASPQVSRETQWNYCISRIVPTGYRLDTSPCFKMVWNHWISTIMFHDFEDASFGLKEAIGSPENLDALTKLGMFDCSRFLAFVKRKYHLLFPPWVYQPPLLKILDGDVYSKFKVIAEKIWMLHQRGRGSDLPPSIFRPVPLGTRYDTQYHESRTPLSKLTEKEPHIILLVFMPGFIVGETVIKSQVLVKKM